MLIMGSRVDTMGDNQNAVTYSLIITWGFGYSFWIKPWLLSAVELKLLDYRALEDNR